MVTVLVGVTLPKETADKIDASRGLAPRSAYIRKIVENAITHGELDVEEPTNVLCH